MRVLLVEFGALDPEVPADSPISFDDRARRTGLLAERLSHEYDILLIPMPYEGLPRRGAPFRNVESTLAGGRGAILTPEQVDSLVSANAKRSVPTMIAANGGLLGDPAGVNLGDATKTIEGFVAESLQRNGRRGVRNGMTLTAPEVQREVNERYPAVLSVASCIRFTGTHDEEAYKDAFRLSHAVVPMPQDFREKSFLRRHKEDARRMMPLLNLGCANPDRQKCRFHYGRLEARAKGVPQEALDRPGLLRELLGSGAFPCICPATHEFLMEAVTYADTDTACRPVCDGQMPIDDTDLLREAIRTGVWQFKIARSREACVHPLLSDAATRLLELAAGERRFLPEEDELAELPYCPAPHPPGDPHRGDERDDTQNA